MVFHSTFRRGNLRILEYSNGMEQSRIIFSGLQYLKVAEASMVSPMDSPRGLTDPHGSQLRWER